MPLSFEQQLQCLPPLPSPPPSLTILYIIQLFFTFTCFTCLCSLLLLSFYPNSFNIYFLIQSSQTPTSLIVFLGEIEASWIFTFQIASCAQTINQSVRKYFTPFWLMVEMVRYANDEMKGKRKTLIHLQSHHYASTGTLNCVTSRGKKSIGLSVPFNFLICLSMYMHFKAISKRFLFLSRGEREREKAKHLVAMNNLQRGREKKESVDNACLWRKKNELAKEGKAKREKKVEEEEGGGWDAGLAARCRHQPSERGGAESREVSFLSSAKLWMGKMYCIQLHLATKGWMVYGKSRMFPQWKWMQCQPRRLHTYTQSRGGQRGGNKAVQRAPRPLKAGRQECHSTRRPESESTRTPHQQQAPHTSSKSPAPPASSICRRKEKKRRKQSLACLHSACLLSWLLALSHSSLSLCLFGLTLSSHPVGSSWLGRNIYVQSAFVRPTLLLPSPPLYIVHCIHPVRPAFHLFNSSITQEQVHENNNQQEGGSEENNIDPRARSLPVRGNLPLEYNCRLRDFGDKAIK